jgi:hypothetical protein
MSFPRRWMEMAVIMLSEVSQRERQVSQVSSHVESRFLKRHESRKGTSREEEGDQWEGRGNKRG